MKAFARCLEQVTGELKRKTGCERFGMYAEQGMVIVEAGSGLRRSPQRVSLRRVCAGARCSSLAEHYCRHTLYDPLGKTV